MASARTPDIRAAGAVVRRASEHGPQVALVHRPRYDDWSLPKGKLEPGEHPVGAAVREIAEETGSVVRLSRRLPTVRYDVGPARKEVSFWLASYISGVFEPNEEVDDLAWLPVAEARARVSYPADRRVLDSALRLPAPEAVVVLVRHARAGKRSAWKGNDCLRPLSTAGRQQADRLAAFLAAFDATDVVSAEPTRCVQTVQPFADSAALTVTLEPVFSDLGFDADPDAAAAALTKLARPGSRTVVSSQGRAIPGLLDRLAPSHARRDTRKGQAWVLGFVDGEVAFADHYPDAGRAPR